MIDNGRTEQRTVCGVKILLPGTESTGFSPVGHLTDQILNGLRKRDDRRDQEEENDGQVTDSD